MSEDTNRKCVRVDGNVLHQKALSPYEDFSKRSRYMSDIKPFPASQGWSHRFRTDVSCKYAVSVLSKLKQNIQINK